MEEEALGGGGEEQVVPFKADNYFSIVDAGNDKNAALATKTAMEKWLLNFNIGS